MNYPHINVLLIEDNPGDARLIEIMLDESPHPDFTVTVARTLADARACLDNIVFDVVLCDLSLPDSKGLQTVETVLGFDSTLPVIVLTGLNDDVVGLQAVNKGAQDYLVKDQIETALLTRAICYAIERNLTERALQQSEARFRSLTENTPAGVYIIQNGCFSYVNPALASMLGYTSDELIGICSETIVHPDDRELVRENIRRRLEHETDTAHYELRCLRKDGTTIYGEALGARIVEDGIPSTIGTLVNVSERTAAHKTIEKERTFLRTLIDNLPDYIYAKDTEAQFTLSNSANAELVGVSSADALIGKTNYDVHANDMALQYLADDRHVIETGEMIRNKEEVTIHTDGSQNWLQTTKVPLVDTDGNITGLIGMGHDITELKELEHALRESERFARATVDALSAHIAILDEEGTILAVNDAWRHFATGNGGSIEKTCEGVNYLDILRSVNPNTEFGEISKSVLEGVHQVFDGKLETFSLEYPGHSPTEQRWFAMRVTRFAGGGPKRIVIAHENITERRLAELELQTSESRYRHLIEDQIDPVFRYDKNLRLTFANRAYCSHYGIERNDILGISILDFIPVGNHNLVKHHIQTLSRENPVSTSVHQSIMSDGSVRWFEWKDRAIFNKQGEIVEYQGIGHDITEQKQAKEAVEEQRVLAETLRETITILTSTLETEQVMERILDNIGRLVPHTGANIMLIEGDTARILHSHGYCEETAAILQQTRYPILHSTLFQMLETQEPFLSDHFEYSLHGQDDLGFCFSSQSYLGSPILIKQQVIGFINLDSDVPNQFTEVHVERLSIFAEQAAIAIQNAQMYDNIHKTTMELSKTQRASELLFTRFSNFQSISDIGAQVSSAVVAAFGLVDAGVILVEPDQNMLVRLDRSEPDGTEITQPLYIDGPGLVPAAIRTKQTMYAPDVTQDPHYVATFPQTQSELAIPLFSGDQVIGVLDIQSDRKNAFDASDHRALQAFAQRAATTIENVRLYATTQDHAKVLKQRVEDRTTQLERMNDRLTAILNNVSDAIILLDREDRIQNTNQSFDRMFEYEHDELYDHKIYQLVSEQRRDVLQEVLQQVAQSQQSQQLEIRMERQSGQTFEADIALAYVKGNGGHMVCSIRDITHLKQVERMKDQFISMVSHELRTPVSSIMLSASTLQRHYDRLTDEQIQRKLGQIGQQAKNLTELVTTVLDISRLDAGIGKSDKEMVNAGQILRHVVSELSDQAKAKRIRVGLSMCGHAMHVIGERTDIARIWQNLLSNAIKYTDEGGQVNVNLYSACPDEDTDCELPDLTAFTDALPLDFSLETYLVGMVQDNGHGIRPQDIDQLFKRFFRGWATATNITGTGLGLALVRDILRSYDGDIAVSSELGVGSTFCFWMPIDKTKRE